MFSDFSQFATQILKQRDNRFFLFDIFIFIYSVAIRLLYLITYPMPVRDSYTYKQYIIQLIEHDFPESKYIPPVGLYILKAPADFFNVDPIVCGTVLNVVLGVLIIIFGLRAFGEICKSFICYCCMGLIIASHPSLISFSCQLSRENLYLLFCILSAYNCIRAIKTRNLFFFALTAVFSAMAFLCRFEGLEIVFFFALALFFYLRRIKDVLEKLLIFLVVYLATIFVVVVGIIGLPFAYFLNLFLFKFSLKFI